MPESLRPLAVDATGLANLLSLSRRKIQQMASSGALGPSPIRFGKSIRYSISEIESWLAAGAPNRDRWLLIRAAQK